MAAIYILEGVNLYCGAEDVGSSKHLTITSLKLPTMEEKTADHHPGGSPFAVTFASFGFNPLTATFHLAGSDPEMLSLFGLGQQLRRRYTAYGALREKLSSRAVQVKSLIEGRLQRVEQDAFSRGNLTGHDYAITEIMHYESYFDGAEKFYFDFASVEWRVDGTSQNDTRRLLGLVS